MRSPRGIRSEFRAYCINFSRNGKREWHRSRGRQRSAVGNGKQRRGRTHEQTFRSFASSYPETFLASGGVGKLRIIETRSLPTLTRFYPRRFTFYVAGPRQLHS